MGKKEDENFKEKYEAMKKLNEQQRSRLENLEKKYYHAKFEPIVNQRDIEDEEFEEYPFLGRSPHRRRKNSPRRTIPAKANRRTMLSETGYGSDFDGTTSTSGRSSQSRQNLHLGESGRLQLTDGPLAKRILALKELKEQAELMQNQIEHQRNNMNQTTRSVAEDEMSLVESEIAAQREMLKEADTTLNNILNKMEDDVVDVSERDPDIRELRKFLSEQNRQTKEKLQQSQGKVDQIAREKKDLEKQFKKYKEEAENQIARLRSQQNSMRKMESPKKVDKRTEEALRNEQVRMALEEKMAEMWHPEEVLQRVATFVNSNFADTGNDEFSEALENISSRAAERESLAAKKAHAESEARNARIKRPDQEMLRKIKDLENQLADKHQKSKQVAQDSLRDRQKIEELEQLVKDLRNRLQESNAKASEAEGAQLAQDKELKRLKANLKLSQQEDDERQKRMEECTGEMNKLRTFRDQELNTRKKLQNENDALQRMLQDENAALISVAKAQEDAKARESQLASQLAETEAINQELQEELENAHQQIDDMETKLQDVEEEGQKHQRLAASRKRKLKDIKKLQTALEDVRDHVNRAIEDRNHDSRMNDRFDEILEALRNLDGRMNQRGHRRTNRVLDAIAELECGLDDLQIPSHFHKLNKRLNRLRDHLEVDARNKDDEFFFVPSGYRPKETTDKEQNAGVDQNADFEAHPPIFKGYVPVRVQNKETAYPVTLKIKKKKRRKPKYDIMITSNPIPLALEASARQLHELGY